MVVRIGLVGTGHWAREIHAAGVAAHPETELAGVWGRDAAKTAALAADLGTTAYDSIEDLIRDVDALTFAVPPMVQAPLAIRAAEAGKHLLLEKPIALDLATADRLAAAASGLTTIVFFTGRFTPPWEQWLDERLSRRTLGGRVEWLGDLTGSPFATPWRAEHGALWDVGPHALSYLLPALGPVVSVVGARGDGDLVHLVLTHEGGATSTMALSLTMRVPGDSVAIELYDDQGYHRRPELSGDDDETPYSHALSELADGIRTGSTRHRCDVHFGRDVVATLAMCAGALAS